MYRDGPKLFDNIKTPKIEFTKIRKVKSPNRGTVLSAGIDFFIPEFDGEFRKKTYEINLWDYFDKDKILIHQHRRILLPLGVHIKMPIGWHMIFFNKGGVANSKGLDVLACVVDEDYQGELFLNLVNTSSTPVTIEENDKIIQGILLQTNYIELKQIENLEKLYTEKTERGGGGFGSTGKK